MIANEALRELSRGLYPIVLSERGLAAALQALAARAPVAVQLSELPRRRFPPLAEATAYFVVAGALAVAPEHAETRHRGRRATAASCCSSRSATRGSAPPRPACAA